MTDVSEATDEASLTIEVTNVNDAPVALADDYTTNEDIVLAIEASGILANDSDQDGPTLTAELVTDVQNGVLVLNPNGSFSYTPDLNSNGTDSFTYKAFDGELYSEAVTVTIHVIAVNDPPVANPQTAETNEDEVKQITLTGFDVEGAALSFLVDAESFPRKCQPCRFSGYIYALREFQWPGYLHVHCASL